MRFKTIQEQRQAYSIPWMCHMLGVARSGFYAWLGRKGSAREKDDEQLRVEIRAFHRASRETYGSPRLRHDLAGKGLHIGRNRIMRLMREEGLRGCRKRK